jgi:hypothetical protein
LFDCHLPREEADRGILLGEADGNFEYAFKPRLGFPDRLRSGLRSGHPFDVEHHLGVVVGESSRFTPNSGRARGECHKKEGPDNRTLELH